MSKRFAFDVRAAIPAAWDVLWASNLKRRKEDLAYEKKVGKKPFDWARSYYICAADVERMVRDFAEDAAEGKPWRKTNTGYGYSSGIRISGNLKGAVRSWLLNNPKIVGHNFGKGHISGMRFRPVGEPMAEVEQKTMEKKIEQRKNPKTRPCHFAKGGYGSRPLCQLERNKGHFMMRQSKAWSTKDRAEVTCKQCLNLLKSQHEALAAVREIATSDTVKMGDESAEPYDRDGYTAGSKGW